MGHHKTDTPRFAAQTFKPHLIRYVVSSCCPGNLARTKFDAALYYWSIDQSTQSSKEVKASSTENKGPAVDLKGDPTRAGNKMRELNPAHLEPERTVDKSINRQTSMPLMEDNG